MTKFLSFMKNNRFGVVSWLVTAALVASMLGGAFWWKNARAADSALVPVPTAGPGDAPTVALPQPPMAGAVPSVWRRIQLVTAGELVNYDPIQYIVERGDAMSKIAVKFDIETESILYNNKDVLNDDPHGLKPGMVLVIPPVDGIYHIWEEGDTIEKVAAEFKAKPEDIMEFPGNEIDLVNPDNIKPGTLVMIPGGSRELFDWSSLALSESGGAGSDTGCGGFRPGSGSFLWPVVGQSHTISGNNFSQGHPGVDMTASQGGGDVVLAADHGVVTFADFSQYGYGNMVQIDHGNGYVTLYAHLTAIFVSKCQPVAQGDQIGTTGNTGNSFGAHLHFEIRYGGAAVNPLGYVQ